MAARSKVDVAAPKSSSIASNSRDGLHAWPRKGPGVFLSKLAGVMETLRPPLLYFVAQTLVYLKQHDRALRAFEILLAREPGRRPRAWSTAAFLYAEKGRLQEAIGAFERALALEPRDATAAFNLAFTLQRVGRHLEALQRFQQAIDLRADLDRAWYGLGLSLAHLDRHAEAAARFAEAARLQPLNPYARYQLAGAWFKLGEHEKVRAEYRRLKGFDPKIAAQVSRDFGVPPDPD